MGKKRLNTKGQEKKKERSKTHGGYREEQVEANPPPNQNIPP